MLSPRSSGELISDTFHKCINLVSDTFITVALNRTKIDLPQKKYNIVDIEQLDYVLNSNKGNTCRSLYAFLLDTK